MNSEGTVHASFLNCMHISHWRREERRKENMRGERREMRRPLLSRRHLKEHFWWRMTTVMVLLLIRPTHTTQIGYFRLDGETENTSLGVLYFVMKLQQCCDVVSMWSAVVSNHQLISNKGACQVWWKKGWSRVSSLLRAEHWNSLHEEQSHKGGGMYPNSDFDLTPLKILASLSFVVISYNPKSFYRCIIGLCRSVRSVVIMGKSVTSCFSWPITTSQSDSKQWPNGLNQLNWLNRTC